MSEARFFSSIEAVRLPSAPLHLAVGMFDGVHLGHRAVVEAALQSARSGGGLAAALTFHPHPSVALGAERPVRTILDAPLRARLLAGLGIDAVVTHPFTRAFAAISADDFLPWLKERLPGLAGLYVGQNWRFGAGRGGDVDFLIARARALGLAVFSAPRVNFDGEPISSTRIRALLEEGDIAGANARLGYSYFAEGPVVPGRHLGRTFGFPTLNLAWMPPLLPRFGVYLARVSSPARPKPLPAVANYGLRPTLGADAEPRLEAHLLVPCPFGKGDTLKVEWLRFQRPEAKFANQDELRARIALDVAEARKELGV